jgi:hypothetical protein
VLIQHFNMKGRRVPDPMRPGRTSIVGYLSASGNSELSYTDPVSGEEVVAHPDSNGWIEVPHEVGVVLCRFRNRGSGFYTPDDIDDSVRLGQFDGTPPPAAEPAPRRRSTHSKAAAEEAADIVGPED